MDTRIAKWDNIKGLLIILVVIGHFIEPLLEESETYRSIFLFIYSFHMPAFFVISGFFHSDDRFDAKSVFFLTLYIVVSVLIFLTNKLLGNNAPLTLLQISGLPWFLLVLVYCFLVTHFVNRASHWFILAMAAIMGIFVGYDSAIGDTLALSRFIVFYPFFLFGYILRRNNVLDHSFVRRFSGKPAIKAVFALLLLVWFLLCYCKLSVLYNLRPVFTGRNPYSVLTLPIEGMLARIICYSIALAAIVSLAVVMPSGKIPLLTHIGRKTLQVYLLHISVRNILFHFVDLHAIIKDGTILVKGLWLLVPILAVILLSANVLTVPLDHIKRYCYGDRETVSSQK